MQPLSSSFGSLSSSTASSSTFPTGSFVPDPHLCLHIFDDEAIGFARDDNSTTDGAISIPRLRSNLEVVWDSVLVLHRRFRGDMTGYAPGVLKASDATRTMTALHAANCDAFASRLLSLMSHTTRAPGHAPDRLRQLDSRLYSAQMQHSLPGQRRSSAGSGGNNIPANSSDESLGVVLHRAPRQVRDVFAIEHGRHLFFLDFIIGADSHRLCAALIPRLASVVCDAVARASRATSTTSFADSVLEARLHAKLLCATLHLGNWAHSSAALSGTIESTQAAPLPKLVRVARASAHGAMCQAVIDVAGLVHAAVRAKEPAAIMTTVAVATDFVRLSTLDPVARDTAWFKDSVKALASTINISPVLKSVIEYHVPQDDLTKYGIADLMPSEQDRVYHTIGTHSTHPRDVQHRNQIPADNRYTVLLNDPRLARAIAPHEENYRSSPKNVNSGRPKRTSAIRRITPIAQDPNSGDQTMKDTDSDGETKNSGKGKHSDEMVQGDNDKPNDAEVDADEEGNQDEETGANNGIMAKLQREFFSRIDARVRELVSVVAAAGNDSTLPPRDAFLSVMNILYPSTPETVAAVAAEICAKKTRRSDTKTHINTDSKDDKLKQQKTHSTPIQYTVERINVPANGVSALERRMTFTGGFSEGMPSSLGAARQSNKMSDHDPP